VSYSTAKRSKTSPIGRFASISVEGVHYVGSVIDAAGRMAKRIRIQSRGVRQGDVVQPGEYKLLEFMG
jgi:hypothetical protein